MILMTSSREMSRNYRPHTDGDFVPVTDNGEGKIEEFSKQLIVSRVSNFIFSLNKVAYVCKLRYNITSVGAVDDAGKRFLVDGGRIC